MVQWSGAEQETDQPSVRRVSGGEVPLRNSLKTSPAGQSNAIRQNRRLSLPCLAGAWATDAPENDSATRAPPVLPKSALRLRMEPRRNSVTVSNADATWVFPSESLHPDVPFALSARPSVGNPLPSSAELLPPPPDDSFPRPRPLQSTSLIARSTGCLVPPRGGRSVAVAAATTTGGLAVLVKLVGPGAPKYAASAPEGALAADRGSAARGGRKVATAGDESPRPARRSVRFPDLESNTKEAPAQKGPTPEAAAESDQNRAAAKARGLARASIRSLGDARVWKETRAVAVRTWAGDRGDAAVAEAGAAAVRARNKLPVGSASPAEKKRGAKAGEAAAAASAAAASWGSALSHNSVEVVVETAALSWLQQSRTNWQKSNPKTLKERRALEREEEARADNAQQALEIAKRANSPSTLLMWDDADEAAAEAAELAAAEAAVASRLGIEGMRNQPRLSSGPLRGAAPAAVLQKLREDSEAAQHHMSLVSAVRRRSRTGPKGGAGFKGANPGPPAALAAAGGAAGDGSRRVQIAPPSRGGSAQPSGSAQHQGGAQQGSEGAQGALGAGMQRAVLVERAQKAAYPAASWEAQV